MLPLVWPGYFPKSCGVYEPWQLADFLKTPHGLRPLGHVADDEGHQMLRASLTEEEKVREDTRNLLLLKWTNELLLEDGEP
jgi:hypothetical protein